MSTIIDCEEATIIGRESDRTTQWIMEAVKSDRKAKTSWIETRGPSCCATSMTTYYSPRLQLQRHLVESLQFEKGNSCCKTSHC